MILGIQILKPWIQLLSLLTNLPMYPKLTFPKSQALIMAFIIVVKCLTTTNKYTSLIPL